MNCQLNELRQKFIVLDLQNDLARSRLDQRRTRIQKIRPAKSATKRAVKGDAHIAGGIRKRFALVDYDRFGLQAFALELAVKFEQQRIALLDQKVDRPVQDPLDLFTAQRRGIFCAQSVELDLFLEADIGQILVVIADPKFFALVDAVDLLPERLVARAVEIQAAHTVLAV